MSEIILKESRMKSSNRVEKFIEIEDSILEIEKDMNMVRMDLNIIEYPIFTKSKKRSKDQIVTYFFKSDKSQYLEIEPNQGFRIPGEFEERVFIALIKVMRDNSYARSFYVSTNEIIEASGISNFSNSYKRVRTAMETLANNTYRFKNILYSSEKKALLEGETTTGILDITRITEKDSGKDEKSYFQDKRVKEIYKISMADHFFDNIIKKGYLVFDSDKLLQISDSITRGIYTLLEKWRGYSLYLRRPIVFLVKKIPLSWDSRSYGRTVNAVTNRCNELKKMGAIKDFNLIKNGKWEKAEIEFFFEETHNKYKRNLFYDDKENHNQNMLIAHTESRGIDVIRENPHAFDEILMLFPPRARKLVNMPKEVEKALNLYDYDYVYYTAEYTTINCKSAYYSYFKKALAGNWAADYISKKKDKPSQMKPVTAEKIVVPEVVEKKEQKENQSEVYGEFLALPERVKKEIKQRAYEIYLEESGTSDTAPVKKIFSKGSINRPYIIRAYKDYEPIDEIEVADIVEEKMVEPELETKAEARIEEREYPSITDFSLYLLGVFRDRNLDINPQDFITLFQLVNEYEGQAIKVSYDRNTKIGRIEYK